MPAINRPALFIAGCLSFFCAGARAAELPTAPGVVVTATRTPSPADSSIASTIIIDRKTLSQSGADDVAQLLKYHAGIDIARNGGPGQPVSAFIRGADSNHTLVLLDGVKLNPGTIGGAALQNIDPSLLQRVEIVKGPRSTLYGSEAIGGVIQLFTHRGEPGWHVSAGGGTDNTRKLSAGFDQHAGAARFGVDVSNTRTNGFPARVGGSVDSGYSNTSANTYFSFKRGATETTLSHWQAVGTSDYYSFALDPLSENYRDAVTAATVKTTVTDTWLSTLKLSRMEDRVDQNQSADFAHTRRDVLDWQNDVQINDHNLVTGGVSLSRETTKAASFGTYYNVHTHVNAVFIQDQWHRERHQLVLGARYLDHSAFGSHATGEAAYGYRLSPKVTLTASAGTGFRAPDSTDRFGYGGNPDLKPETSRNLEAALRITPTPSQQVRVTVFRNDLDNLINFVDPDGYLGPLPGRNENVDKARISGIEARYVFTRGPWNVDLEGVAQNPRNRVTGLQLARRARRSLTANVRYARGAYRLGVNVLATGARPDSDFSTTMDAGYNLVGLTAERRFGPHWRLSGRVDNLFDRHYVLADGYNTQGRAVFVFVEYRQTGFGKSG